jgi:hypothetical protein
LLCGIQDDFSRKMGIPEPVIRNPKTKPDFNTLQITNR